MQKKKKSLFSTSVYQSHRILHLGFLLPGEAISFIPAHYVKGEVDVSKAWILEEGRGDK